MLTSPVDVLKWRLHIWFHDYAHRAQVKEKQIKRWRKLKARLADVLAEEDIYELHGWWYRYVNRPTEHNEVWHNVITHAQTIDTEHHAFRHFTLIRGFGSKLTDVQLSGPGGSVIFGRRTKQKKGRK